MSSHEPRPTVRCLIEQLAEKVEDAAQKSSLVAGCMPDISVRLSEVDHPLVRKHLAMFGDGVVPPTATKFQSVADRVWWEVQHGERLRGLSTNHDGGFWLGFAGWHTMSSVNDVFKVFTTRCNKGGSKTVSSEFLPNSDDRIRLSAEDRFAEMEEARLNSREAVLSLVVKVMQTPSDATSAELSNGTRVTAKILDGDPDEFTITFAFEWIDNDNYGEMFDVAEMIPGLAKEEWELIHPGPGGQPAQIWALVDRRWAIMVAEAVAERGLASLAMDPSLCHEPPDGLAHRLPAGVATEAYVEGNLAIALCRHRFIPYQDVKGLPECETCRILAEALTLLQSA